MSANEIATKLIKIDGKPYKLLLPLGEGTYGVVYRVYPIENGMVNEKKPLAVKFHKIPMDAKVIDQIRAQLRSGIPLKGIKEFGDWLDKHDADLEFYEKDLRTESEKTNLLFDSLFYRLDLENWFLTEDALTPFITVMPELPGEPILDSWDQPHEGLADLTLGERLQLAALVAHTYAEFHADRLNKPGLRHTDSKPGNILIAIKRTKEGRVFFQCNIIDFANLARTANTLAPEFFSNHQDIKDRNTPTLKMDIYALTASLATILGENDVFREKNTVEPKEDYNLCVYKISQQAFYLEGMIEYLGYEFLNLKWERDEQFRSKKLSPSQHQYALKLSVELEKRLDAVGALIKSMGDKNPNNRPENCLHIAQELLKAASSYHELESFLYNQKKTSFFSQKIGSKKEPVIPITDRVLSTRSQKPQKGASITKAESLAIAETILHTRNTIITFIEKVNAAEKASLCESQQELTKSTLLLQSIKDTPANRVYPALINLIENIKDPELLALIEKVVISARAEAEARKKNTKAFLSFFHREGIRADKNTIYLYDDILLSVNKTYRAFSISVCTVLDIIENIKSLLENKPQDCSDHKGMSALGDLQQLLKNNRYEESLLVIEKIEDIEVIKLIGAEVEKIAAQIETENEVESDNDARWALGVQANTCSNIFKALNKALDNIEPAQGPANSM